MNENRTAKILSTALFALFFIAVFLICANVFPYGDDFFYGTFTKEGFARYVARHIEHYQLANGRVMVHLLATFFLGQNLWLWRIVNALSFALCAVLIVKIAKPDPKDQPLCMTLVIAIFLIISPQITRQSLYWLTGSLNYLYPMLTLLVYWRLLQRGLEKQSRLVWLPVFAFFASATTEQGGLMCLGVTFLLLLNEKFICKNRIRPAHVIALLTSIIGILTVLLAPGVANRVDMTASPASGGLFSLILYNLKTQGGILFFKSYMRIFHICMLFFAIFLLACYAAKTQNSKMRTCHALGAMLGVIGLVCYLCIPEQIKDASRACVALALTAYLVTLFWCGISMLRTKKDSTLLIVLILAFGSQLAMIVSPVAGPRTMTSFVFMAALFLAKAGTETIYCGAIGAFGTLFCALMGQPYLTVITAPSCYFGVWGKSARRVFLYLGIVPILISALFYWYDTYTHTAQNAQVYRENISAIESYPGSGTLTQKKLPCGDYAWVMPYHNDYYNPYYNIFFDLPSNTQISWIS